MSIQDDCIAYLTRLSDAATVMTTGSLASHFGHTRREGRRRVDRLAGAGFVRRVHGRGVAANALGHMAAERMEPGE